MDYDKAPVPELYQQQEQGILRQGQLNKYILHQNAGT